MQYAYKQVHIKAGLHFHIIKPGSVLTEHYCISIQIILNNSSCAVDLTQILHG